MYPHAKHCRGVTPPPTALVCIFTSLKCDFTFRTAQSGLQTHISKPEIYLCYDFEIDYYDSYAHDLISGTSSWSQLKYPVKCSMR